MQETDYSQKKVKCYVIHLNGDQILTTLQIVFNEIRALPGEEKNNK